MLSTQAVGVEEGFKIPAQQIKYSVHSKCFIGVDWILNSFLLQL
jgi:hypothetical protein